MTANREEAEDIAAEALARAYASWGKVGALQYRDAWVLRTATNLIVDLARRPTLLLRADADVAIPGFEDALTERSTLVGALKRLPRRQREAVVLRYLADYSVEEVSLAMRTSVNTVKKHLSRGLARLRDITSSSTSRK